MKKVFENNLFLFKYILKYGRVYIPLIFISAVFQAASVVAGVLGTKFIIDAISVGKPFIDIMYIILIYAGIVLITQCFFTWTNYYFPLVAKKVSIGMSVERMDSSKRLDFQCFDNPEYYNQYTRALATGESQVSTLVGSLIALFANIVTLVSVITILAQYNLLFILFALIDVVVSYFVIVKQNKEKFSFDYENIGLIRKENYYKGLCLEPAIQKEAKIYNVIEYFKEKYESTSQDFLKNSKGFS